MKRNCPLLLLLCFVTVYGCSQTILIDTAKMGQHPRLLLKAKQEELIKQMIAGNPVWANLHEGIITECDNMLSLPPIERVLIGRRLLTQSREGLRRIFYLAYAWRITGQKRYFKRCEEELLAISRFSDWHPDHFLDVAELALGVAIGYDWLYKDLSPASRAVIAQALTNFAMKPAMDSKYNGWSRGKNNWNQVCNTGVTYAAIATYEDNPALSVQLIQQAVQSIRIPMKEYAPVGNYPEGYSYWGYGTSYNVFFISALEQLLGTDFGLSQMPGFLQTASFYGNLTGPTGKPFNYSDCGGAEGLQPAMIWFAGKSKDPAILWTEGPRLRNPNPFPKWDRFLPATLVWGINLNLQQTTPPGYHLWNGGGENPIAIMRSSWTNPQAIYVGFKGGSPALSHAHMDIGSFVMDADGERWSADPGMQDYESMESKGLNIWDMTQQSDRWKVFRYSNFSHSTLTVNNSLQNINGKGIITKHIDDSLFTRTVMDIGDMYKGSLSKATRGIAIVNQQYVMVRDELETGDSACTIRWAMFTPAAVAGIQGTQAQLTNHNKKLTLAVQGLPEGTTLTTWRTDPQHNYDALNPGTTLVGFELTLPAHTKTIYNVFLLPGNNQVAIKKSSLKPLSDW